jgi:hypothetical protein
MATDEHGFTQIKRRIGFVRVNPCSSVTRQALAIFDGLVSGEAMRPGAEVKLAAKGQNRFSHE